MHSSFTDIGQFRDVIKAVKQSAQFVRIDENGDVIVDRFAPMPVVKFRGTCKLHGCFHSDTPITLANGERCSISKLKVGTYILSYDTENKIELTKKVKAVYKNELKKEWCKLVFDDREVICTKDHKFWTTNRGWVEAKDLTIDDDFLTE